MDISLFDGGLTRLKWRCERLIPGSFGDLNPRHGEKSYFLRCVMRNSVCCLAQASYGRAAALEVPVNAGKQDQRMNRWEAVERLLLGIALVVGTVWAVAANGL